MMETAAPPLSLEEQAERIARDLNIPPCPAILGRFAAAIRKEEPDLRLLAGFIGNDVALSAAMINMVNSPFYGSQRKANNVQQALYIMGLQACANVIAGLLLRNAFPAGSGAMMQQFWDESALMVETAADIAPHLPDVDREIAHTYALFRDCGMAVMIAKFDNYQQLADINARKPGMALLLAEEAHYRFNHARVGYALASRWLLPEFLCNAILQHHDIERFTSIHCNTNAPEAKLVAFGMLVEQVAALRSRRGLRPDWAPGEAFVLKTLNLEPGQIIALCEPQTV